MVIGGNIIGAVVAVGAGLPRTKGPSAYRIRAMRYADECPPSPDRKVGIYQLFKQPKRTK